MNSQTNKTTLSAFQQLRNFAANLHTVGQRTDGEYLRQLAVQMETEHAALNAIAEIMPEIISYLDLKLIGFRRDYPEEHCIVQTAKNLQTKCSKSLSALDAIRGK